jgi:hypothetical protein
LQNGAAEPGNGQRGHGQPLLPDSWSWEGTTRCDEREKERERQRETACVHAYERGTRGENAMKCKACKGPTPQRGHLRGARCPPSSSKSDQGHFWLQAQGSCQACASAQVQSPSQVPILRLSCCDRRWVTSPPWTQVSTPVKWDGDTCLTCDRHDQKHGHTWHVYSAGHTVGARNTGHHHFCGALGWLCLTEVDMGRGLSLSFSRADSPSRRQQTLLPVAAIFTSEKSPFPS